MSAPTRFYHPELDDDEREIGPNPVDDPEIFEKKAIQRTSERIAEMKAKQCGRLMTTPVWGNTANPDQWNCSLPKGHKGAHQR